MNYLQSPIFTEKTQCQDCYKCIRECPVKAIRVENGHAMIISERCVLCGHCVTTCPAGAKIIRDDLARTRQLLKLKERVVVSIAPSFAAEFPDIKANQLSGALKKLGFFAVSETAIGADLVSAEVADILQYAATHNSQKLFLSSACPTAVEYIKQYMPELAPGITDLASPLLAHARYLRRELGPDIGIVFIGPCISKKREADIWDEIDCAITFRDLKRWFNEAGIRCDSKPTDSEGFFPERAAKGALYPIDGGMIAAIKKYMTRDSAHMMTITGLDEIDRGLRGLDPAKLEHPLFIEILACPGGCINGPAVSHDEPTALRRIRLLQYAQNAADTSTQTAPALNGTIPAGGSRPKPGTEEEIRSALRMVGKYSIEDELNCGSCGYDTCRSFAQAMLDHCAERTMCVSYMRKLAQKKANGLIRTMPSGVVICDANLKIIECNENFARIMGGEIPVMFQARPGLEGAEMGKISNIARFFTDVIAHDGPDVIDREVREHRKILHVTVFAIEKGDSACGVIQDITAPSMHKNRVIQQTRKVINHNLAVVQKIAFLLGENAAETEATLNSIIESFSESEEDAQ